MTDRRAFVVGSLTLLAPPLAAGAPQSEREYRVGILIAYPYVPGRAVTRFFVPTLQELGYVEGRNLRIEVRSADYHLERLPVLAEELVRLKVDAIVTGGDSEVRAAKAATRSIPIVMSPSGDPVRAGYVASYARPGGNVTGLSWMSPDLSVKLLQILKDAVPNASHLAVLWNSANPVKAIDFEETRHAAETLGFRVSSVDITAASKLDTALAAIARVRPDGLVILTDETLNAPMYPRIVGFATQHRLPSILGEASYATAGGFIGYGPSVGDLWRRAAHYVDKLLKGARASDLPVEAPTKFELIINLKTAKTLSLTIPPSLLARADQVIE